MSRLIVTPDPANPVGHGLIRVRNGGSSAPVTRLQIERPDWSDSFLGSEGWQVAAATVAPLSVATNGADQLIRVGPAICAHVESGVYIISLPELGLEESIVWPDIVPPHGGAFGYFGANNTIAARPTQQPPEPQEPPPLPPIPQPPPPQPPFHPPPIDPTPTPPKPPLTLGDFVPWLLALLAVLIVAGGGSYAWFRLHADVPPILLQPRAERQAPPAGRQAPPAERVDLDHASVPDLTTRNHPDELLDQARKRMAARPQESMLLLEVAGDDDHFGPALTMLARIYDPNKPRQGGIPADLRQSARYYREAITKGDASGASDRDALHQTVLQQKNQGNLTAKLTDQDYWP